MSVESIHEKIVYVVDDNPDLARLIGIMAQKYTPEIPMNIQEFHSFGETEQALRARQPNLVFLNPTLQDRLGKHLFELTQDDGTPLLKSGVIVVTGGITPEDEAEFRRYGVIDILQKPQDITEQGIRSVTLKALQPVNL